MGMNAKNEAIAWLYLMYSWEQFGSIFKVMTEKDVEALTTRIEILPAERGEALLLAEEK